MNHVTNMVTISILQYIHRLINHARHKQIFTILNDLPAVRGTI